MKNKTRTQHNNTKQTNKQKAGKNNTIPQNVFLLKQNDLKYMFASSSVLQRTFEGSLSRVLQGSLGLRFYKEPFFLPGEPLVVLQSTPIEYAGFFVEASFTYNIDLSRMIRSHVNT